MKLSQTDKDIVDREYGKLVAIINYIADNTDIDGEKGKSFIIQAAIEIYRKM